ncbi:MAG: hypothetical protein AVO34_06775 [Firmicutes bacterium ML8_F2]|jgi:DNA repair exonuclease SbcCD ATPase subunit|nr:MAG: hypothetical protein AVO34_06775 [Firmicutes bacterium ML8_F2]
MAKILKKENSLQQKIESIKKEIDFLTDKYRKTYEASKNEKTLAKSLFQKKKLLAGLAMGWFLVLFLGVSAFWLPLFAIVTVMLIAAEKQSSNPRINRLAGQIRALKKDLRSWEKGLEGETLVYQELLRLPDDYYVLNDIKIFSYHGKAQIDHIVVGKKGVIVIETKHGRFFSNYQEQAQRKANILSRILKIETHAIVVFSRRPVAYRNNNSPVPAIQLDQLITFIHDMPDSLSSFSQIERLAHQCLSISHKVSFERAV